MAIKITESKIELHQWFNSIGIGFIAFLATQIYLKVDKDHDVLTGHEFRITALEGNKKDKASEPTAMYDATIPDKLKVKTDK